MGTGMYTGDNFCQHETHLYAVQLSKASIRIFLIAPLIASGKKIAIAMEEKGEALVRVRKEHGVWSRYSVRRRKSAKEIDEIAKARSTIFLPRVNWPNIFERSS